MSLQGADHFYCGQRIPLSSFGQLSCCTKPSADGSCPERHRKMYKHIPAGRLSCDLPLRRYFLKAGFCARHTWVLVIEEHLSWSFLLLDAIVSSKKRGSHPHLQSLKYSQPLGATGLILQIQPTLNQNCFKKLLHLDQIHQIFFLSLFHQDTV